MVLVANMLSISLRRFPAPADDVRWKFCADEPDRVTVGQEVRVVVAYIEPGRRGCTRTSLVSPMKPSDPRGLARSGAVDTDCPRNRTRNQMIFGLKAGRTLCVDRRDAPELLELLEMQEQGLVESRLLEIDEQSSVLKFRWKE